MPCSGPIESLPILKVGTTIGNMKPALPWRCDLRRFDAAGLGSVWPAERYDNAGKAVPYDGRSAMPDRSDRHPHQVEQPDYLGRRDSDPALSLRARLVERDRDR